MNSRSTDGRGEQRRMDEVVDEALQHVEADQAVEPKPAERSRLGALVLLVFAAAAVGWWNVRVARQGVPPLPDYRQETALMGVVTVLSRQVENVHSATGAYPATLDGLAPPLEGISYLRTEGGYALEAVAGGVRVTFQSDREPQFQTGRVEPDTARSVR
jgi:hypothetical protein